MSTGLLQDRQRRTNDGARRACARCAASDRPGERYDRHDGSQRLPTRRIRLSRASIRTLLQIADLLIATSIVAAVLLWSEIGILSATVSQILPFVLIVFAATWGLRLSSAYRLLQRRAVIDHMLATAYGSGLPLALVGIHHNRDLLPLRYSNGSLRPFS